jgi:hypothetical protein
VGLVAGQADEPLIGLVVAHQRVAGAYGVVFWRTWVEVARAGPLGRAAAAAWGVAIQAEAVQLVVLVELLDLVPAQRAVIDAQLIQGPCEVLRIFSPQVLPGGILQHRVQDGVIAAWLVDVAPASVKVDLLISVFMDLVDQVVPDV